MLNSTKYYRLQNHSKRTEYKCSSHSNAAESTKYLALGSTRFLLFGSFQVVVVPPLCFPPITTIAIYQNAIVIISIHHTLWWGWRRRRRRCYNNWYFGDWQRRNSDFHNIPLAVPQYSNPRPIRQSNLPAPEPDPSIRHPILNFSQQRIRHWQIPRCPFGIAREPLCRPFPLRGDRDVDGVFPVHATDYSCSCGFRYNLYRETCYNPR